jgi:hypothetical protein
MKKPLNHHRRIRALETATVRPGSNPVARAMIIQKRGGHHGDLRKTESKSACRGKVSSWD